MNEQIKAGADIHAGDGGYSISTKEKYEAFVKLRNQSMNGKLKELMIEAGYAYPEGATRAHKLAELIAKECAEICLEMAAKCAGLPGDGALAKDCAYWIKNDFGVELDVNETLRNRSTYFGNDI